MIKKSRKLTTQLIWNVANIIIFIFIGQFYLNTVQFFATDDTSSQTCQVTTNALAAALYLILMSQLLTNWYFLQ